VAPDMELRSRAAHLVALLAPLARNSGPVDWRDARLTCLLAALVRRQAP
jgi:hypothetical protein